MKHLRIRFSNRYHLPTSLGPENELTSATRTEPVPPSLPPSPSISLAKMPRWSWVPRTQLGEGGAAPNGFAQFRCTKTPLWDRRLLHTPIDRATSWSKVTTFELTILRLHTLSHPPIWISISPSLDQLIQNTKRKKAEKKK